MSVRETATKLTEVVIFTWKILCDWKCCLLWTVCSLSYGQKKIIQFCAWMWFGKNSTCLIKTGWVIARLPASFLIAPGYCQLAALVHLQGSCQPAAEQTLHRGLLYLLHTSLVRSMGKEKGKLPPKKQSLISCRTDASQVVWKCGDGL